jgi:hypothetical protein
MRTSSSRFLSHPLREFLYAPRASAFRFRPQTKSLAVTHDDPTHTDIVAEALEGGFIKRQ